MQPIIQAVVQEAVWPNKTYIQAATGHLSEWGQALHDMLNSDGASAEEWERTNRAARLAGLKCVWSLLADGQAFNEAEEQDTEQKLRDTIQAALKVANKWADKTFVKVNKRIPGSSGDTYQTIRREHSSPLCTGAWAITTCQCMGW